MTRHYSLVSLLALAALGLGACSVNPATGRQQFDGLLPASQEASIGAQQHQQIVAQYGGVYNNPQLQAYVDRVGQQVARNTERSDVRYTFTLLDSPVVNAFALPGGYVYVTRGILAVANDEAELAGVLGHEIGHVTGRHQAARYSQGLLTTLGATVIGAAVGDANVTRALGMGNSLYMSSYSRDQESEADNLGIRYLSRAGYDTYAMADFLGAMGQYTNTESRIAGKEETEFSYFSTHPATAGRVTAATQEAGRYGAQKERKRDEYLRAVDGMTFGDSAEQGFVRGQTFYHPRLGFTFTAPPNYTVVNQPDQVAAAGKDGAVMMLDMANNAGRLSPVDYLVRDWMKGERMNNPESITIGGFPAATDSFPGTLNSRPVNVRIIAIQWAADKMVRFQIAIPQNAGAGTVENLKSASYSFRRMTDGEKNSIRPQRLQVVTARTGDTTETMAQRMQVDKAPLDVFRALNKLNPGQPLVAGNRYKIVVN